MSARITEALRNIANTPALLVALDFDGTVSHLADDPMAVRAVPEARTVIDRLSHLDDTYVAFVSGRSLRDLSIVTERPEVSPILLVGSHGAEYLLPAVLADAGADEHAEPDDVAALAEGVARAVEAYEGAWVERKAVGFAVHVRPVAPTDRASALAEADAYMRSAAPAWRRRRGKNVAEYSWRHDGKDDALRRLRAITGASAVLFAGDDVTDEDAMRTLVESDLGVRVGEGETSAAVRVASPEDLAKLLDVVASIRARREQ